MHLPKRFRPYSRHILLITALLSGIVSVSVLYATVIHTSGGKQPVKQQFETVSARADLLGKQWSYMPGVSRAGNVLKVEPAALSIVEQDGSGGQPNPPINLYGVHLEDATNFRLSASVSSPQGSAILQFYGSVPLIADEFLIEAKSLRLTVLDGTLTAEVRNGNGQDAIERGVYSISIRRPIDIGFIHNNGTLEVRANGKSLGSLDSHGIFNDRRVWFGLDGTAPWELTHFSADPIEKANLTIADSSTLTIDEQDTDNLQMLASKKRPGFLVGAAMALGPAVSDPEYASVALGGNFGAMTPENGMKWQAIHPSPERYTFQQADALVDLAKRNGLSVHGHTLVFGEANPAWVTNLPLATGQDKLRIQQTMQAHIATVVGRYKDTIASWDVVNEPLADYDDFDKDTMPLRNHIWHKAMGESYIATAFREARKADHDAQLFINEYGLEADDERWDAFLALVTRLKQQGVPIDGVGFQAHVYDEGDRIDVSSLRRHIQQLAKLGLKSRVAEIDVYAWGGSENQAAQYANTLKACIAEPTCMSYTTWGVSDRYNTYKDDGVVSFGKDFLWDSAMKPTAAVNRMREVLLQ